MDLSQHPTRLFVNDTLFTEGSGGNVLGDPVNAVAWIPNHLQSQGVMLTAGKFITTGTVCTIYPANSGDQIKADFGELGSVSLSFE